MKRIGLAVALLVAAGAASAYVMLPAPAREVGVSGTARPRPVRGAIHVHSRRSDGTGTVEQIAAAAARAGLQFVVLTDHGTAARHPEPPRYVAGVLCIDAVEISADGGHAVAIGLPRAPYPLGGEARDVIEDIARLGGVSIAAHPGSSNPSLQWRDWTAPVDGIEWLNGDSEWRNEAPRSLARALLTYSIRPVETLGALLDRPEAILARWDALLARRRVVAIAAADAHARLGIGDSTEPYGGTALVRAPGYEQMFRAFSVALPGLSLTGDAAADASAIVERLRIGSVYSSLDALAAPAVLSFEASGGAGRVGMGGALDAGMPVTLQVETGGPADATIVLLRNGKAIERVRGVSLTRVESGGPAVYRVEVHLPGAPGEPPAPWMLSNPIYVRGPEPTVSAPEPPREFAPRYEDGAADGWRIERDPRSQAALDVVPALTGTQLSLRYALGGAASESPYVALAMPAQPGLPDYDRLRFTALADRPMRLSVQVRLPNAGPGERWHRSVYVDEMPREITVAFDDMLPRGPARARRPVLSEVRDVLFVIDTVNTAPGTSGVLRLDDVKYAR